MSSPKALITVASWEPRFRLGTTRLVDSNNIQMIIMFFFHEFRHRTESSRKEVQALAECRGIRVVEQSLEFDSPIETWQILMSTIWSKLTAKTSVLVDISTMPRETIWATLFWLEQLRSRIHYAYHRPESYGLDWLARDPSEPRLVYKLAGTVELERPMALIVVTGYDVDRTSQAIEYFQPNRTALIAQTGCQFDNLHRNIDVHDNLTKSHDIELIRSDSFSDDHGYVVLKDVAAELATEHNVLMFSFGPKVGAVALYRVQREISSAGLGFIHCREYSPDYSYGITNTILGTL